MKTRVLIIDSDIMARRAIAGILHKTSEFEIIEINEDVNKAEEAILNSNPEVVLLNIEGIESDGFSVLIALRNRFPKLPIVILSVRNEKGAETTITALEKGAVDFITKPETHLSVLFADNHLRKRLVPSIKAASQINNLDNIFPKKTEFTEYPYDELISRAISQNFISTNLVVIGGCMGGPHALFSIIPQLPENLPVPVVIAQHFPKIYTKFLADQLDLKSKITVREAYNETRLTPGIVWIAPGGYHTEIVRGENGALLNIHRGPRKNFARPSIDLLFNSAAYSYKKEVLGIILSGCGFDGVEGCQTIRNHSGQIIVQDPRDSLAPEMPLNVLKRGLANDYFSAHELPLAISNRMKINEKDVRS